MTTKNKNCFIDTDIIQKLGGFKGEKLLKKVLCSFDYNLHIHEYLVNEELIFGENALEQLREMINTNEIIVMGVGDLSNDELNEYHLTSQLLAKEMRVDLEKKRDRNAGEVKSMAIAFAKSFEYFISDDRGARVAAKKHLQKLDGSYLETIRMRDIILYIHDHEKFIGIDRKTAKQLYLYGTNPKYAQNPSEKSKMEFIHNKLKKEFDEELWPVNNPVIK